jgi:hypothetical protein
MSLRDTRRSAAEPSKRVCEVRTAARQRRDSKMLWTLACVFLLSCAAPAHAFYNDGTCKVLNTTATTVTPVAPTGTLNSGTDTIVLAVFASGASTGSITSGGGTGSWTTQLASTAWNGANGQATLVTHVYQSGDTFPTFADGGVSTNWTYVACAHYGVNTTTPVDHITTQTTSSSATVNFASLTATSPSEEALFIGSVVGSQTFSSPSTLTTCSTTTDQAQIATSSTAGGSRYCGQMNMGPCAAHATGTATVTATGTPNSIGIPTASASQCCSILSRICACRDSARISQ